MGHLRGWSRDRNPGLRSDEPRGRKLGSEERARNSSGEGGTFGEMAATFPSSLSRS